MFNRTEKIILFCLSAIQFNHIVDFMIVMPLGPKLMRIFQISPDQFSLLVSMYTLAAGVSGFLATFYVDKFDRKKNMLFMFGGFIISTVLCGMATNYEMLLIARSFAGFFGGIMNSLILSIVSDLINYERRGTAMGMISTAFSTASIAGVPLSLFLSDLFDWHAPFVFLGLLSLFIFIIAYKFIPSMKGHVQKKNNQDSLLKPFIHIFQDPTQVYSLLFMFMLMFGHFAIIPFMSPYLVANVGLSEKHLPLVYLVGGICSMITAPLIGKISDKKGKSKVFTVALISSVVPILLVTHQQPAAMPVTLFISGLFFTSALSRMIPAQAIISTAATPAYRGSFLSVLSCVQSLSMAMGSWIAGKIIIQETTGRLSSYSVVGYISIAFGFLALVLFQKIKFLDFKKEEAHI